MGCCARCLHVVSRTYVLGGDGDGVEFLVETSLLDRGEEVVATAQLSLL